MSILTDLLSRKITFSQAETAIEAWGEKLITGDPILAASAGQVVSDLKQAASNAVSIAGTDIEPFITPAANTVATAVETALAAVTKGATLPLNPLITNGFDTIGNALKSEIDVAIAKAKAALALPVVTTPPQTAQVG